MGSKPQWAEQIARERIDILFAEAEDAVVEHPERADRYVELARTIAMTFELSLPRRYRERVCSSCYRYLSSGRTATVRIAETEKRVTCAACGHMMRFPLDADTE